MTDAPDTASDFRLARDYLPRRERLLAQIDNQDFHTLKTKIATVLRDCPWCRDNDADLTIELYRRFYPEHVSNGRIALTALRVLPRGETIKRTRADIQNRLALFPASPEVTASRMHRAEDLRGFFRRAISKESVDTLVYCDESGLKGRYLIVGAIWLDDMERRPDLMHDIRVARQQEGVTGELKFSGITRTNVNKVARVFKQVGRHFDHVYFGALLSPRRFLRAKSHIHALQTCMSECLLRGIEDGVGHGRYSLGRVFRCVKDEDQNADADLLPGLERMLHHRLEATYKDKMIVQPTSSCPGADNYMIQLADLFCGSLNRVVNEKTTGHVKDRFAAMILELLKLERDDPLLVGDESRAKVWLFPRGDD